MRIIVVVYDMVAESNSSLKSTPRGEYKMM